jgi:hypothetical protein
MWREIDEAVNRLVDQIADLLAGKPGFLPLFGLALILINFVLQFFPGSSAWVVDSNLFLHLGLFVTIIGLLLIRPFG